jgi:hypothetical protein
VWSFDTISHELLLAMVGRRVGDVRVMRLIRAWLKAGVMEEGKVTHPDRGSPQGGECRYYLILTHDLGYGQTESLTASLEETSRLLNAYARAILASGS